jgi:hypothetical protein
MSTYSFFQAHVRNTLTGDTFVGHNSDNKVLPDCDTPANATTEEQVLMSDEEKMQEVLSDPKFGMFSLFAYQVTTGYQNRILKKRNAVFCSHLFSLVLALPILVFVTQWMMYIAIVSHQVRSYSGGVCPNTANIEEKILMAAVAMFYFIKSFFLWDNIVDRTRRKKMIPSTSYIVMLDTFQEFGFNLLVYTTNLWVIFAEPDFLNMFFNTIAMEFLMDMDNEFERQYFSFLPGVAVDIYDNMFVSYRDNILMVNDKTQTSACFLCCRRCTWLPFKFLIIMFMALPIVCFVFIFYGSLCK